jgi:hypothetical protein
MAMGPYEIQNQGYVGEGQHLPNRSTNTVSK